MGKTVLLPEDPTGALQRHTKKDASLALRGQESGVVDQVCVHTHTHTHTHTLSCTQVQLKCNSSATQVQFKLEGQGVGAQQVFRARAGHARCGICLSPTRPPTCQPPTHPFAYSPACAHHLSPPQSHTPRARRSC